MRRFRLLYKYVVHFFEARNTNGFGVHSPFVFHFTNYVLKNKGVYYAFAKIESIRSELKQDQRIIDIQDFGTGTDRRRRVASIANRSLKSQKYGQLLFRMVNYFDSKNVLELGTSLGVTAAYLASPSTKINCISLEGCPQTAKIATENFKKINIENVKVVVGNIGDTLNHILSEFDSLDFVFFDANHRSEFVLNYFEMCISKVNDNSVMVFDDIYWSEDMEVAWEKIQQHPRVMSTIDLFQVGIVFFNPDLHKKHYKMRY